ncbi:hypothetical protein ACHAXS_010144 [Conticribra weissflogii]
MLRSEPCLAKFSFYQLNIQSLTITMAEEDTAPDAMQFDLKEYDVTCCLEYLHCGSTKLILGKEEAEMKRNVCFGLCNSTKRGPYGELGTVDIAHVCCFIGFAANSLMLQQGQCQSTGCGCEQQKVNEIVTELKRRQAFRGDRAKVRLAETTLSSINDLNAKVDLILDHLNLTPPETAKALPVTPHSMAR